MKFGSRKETENKNGAVRRLQGHLEGIIVGEITDRMYLSKMNGYKYR